MGALTDPEIDTIKMYVSLDDEIWYIAGANVPTPSGYEYDEFCKKPKLINKKSKVRLVGSARNARLICKMFSLQIEGSIASVEVCSPQVETIDLCEYSPENVLINMRKWLYPSSIGGFHKVKTDDFLVYSMVHSLRDTPEKLNHVDTLFSGHPVHSILKFIPFLSKGACADVVSLIIDPRWYADLNSPNKLANLFNYMGVSSLKPPSESLDMGSPSLSSSKMSRRHAVVASWRNDLNLETDFKGNFLIRTYSKVRETFLPGKVKKGELPFDEADLATSQKFLAFIYATWLNWLYPMPNPWAETLFVPEYFFSSKEEVARFKAFFYKKP